MDVSAIVLNKLLSERNLELWAKLKLAFLDSAYSNLYSVISKHYDRYNEIPSFDELEVSTREGPTQKLLATVKLINEPDISAEVALDALVDQYTQNQTVNLLDKFIDKLPTFETTEIKEGLSNIVLQLDEKTLSTEGVYNMSDILLFKTDTELDTERVHLGLNNTFDAVLGGMARQELLLIGGERGSGKSITVNNIFVNQYEIGNTCVYFSIEMIAHETLERALSISADVPYMALKQNRLTPEDLLKVIKVRAGMFNDAEDLVIDFLRHRDRFKFESTLVKTKQLKEDNQMIIIDDRALTLTSIDLHLGKLKARFGKKLKVAVVDYMNQVLLESSNSSRSDQFDWKPQVVVSKKLKELARKHEVAMISPYQIDADGQARFAKGILDACDIALIMKAYKDQSALGFDTTKIRGGPDLHFTSGINWDTLRISPIPIDRPDSKAAEKPIKNATHKKKNTEKAHDVPWD